METVRKVDSVIVHRFRRALGSWPARLAGLLLLVAGSGAAAPPQGPEIAWVRQYGGPGPEVPFGLAAGTGGVAVTGSFSGQAVFDSAPGEPPVELAGRPGFVVASDGAGRIRWARGLGTKTGIELRGLAFPAGAGRGAAGPAQLVAGGYFIATLAAGPGAPLVSAGSADAFLLAFDPRGETVWGRRWGEAFGDAIVALAAGPAGSLYAAGSFQRTLDLGPAGSLVSAGSHDAFLLALDAGGRPRWAVRIGGAGRDRGLAVAVGEDGAAYLAGTFRGRIELSRAGGAATTLESAGGVDAFLVRVEADGRIGWGRRVGGSQNEQVAGVGIGPGGDAILAGSFQGALDASGDGASAAAGTDRLEAAGVYDAFVGRWSAGGERRWLHRLGGGATDLAQGLAVSPSGDEIYLAGSFQGRADFDPGPGVAELATEAAGNADAFVLALDASGALLWARRFGGDGVEQAFGVAIDADGGLYVSGLFNRRIEFAPIAPTGPTPADPVLESRGKTDLFLVKLTF